MWLPFGGHNATGKLDKFLFGGGPRAIVPPDLGGLRQEHIDLLSALLKPGAFGAGGAGRNFFYGGADPNAPTTEMTTFEHIKPILEGMLTGTGANFEADIARANQTGGRFSSGNAIMRGSALGHLFDSRTQNAALYGNLAGQAGQAQRGQQTQLMQLIASLFGMRGQATLGLPVQNDKGAFGDILGIAATLFGGGGMGGGGSGSGGGGSYGSPQAWPGGVSP